MHQWLTLLPHREKRSLFPLLARAGVLTLWLGVLLAAGGMARSSPAHAQPFQPQASTVRSMAHDGLHPRSDIFIRGPGGALWHRGWEGDWFPWENLGVTIDAAPSAVKGSYLF